MNRTELHQRFISVDYAAEMIGVSSATIRNWAKEGHIRPVNAQPLSFSENSVLNLKNRIESGSLKRLTKRANKVGSISNILPVEYATNLELIGCVENIVEHFKSEQLEIEPILFVASLRLLETDGEVSRHYTSDVFDLNSYHSWVRESVKIEIQDWRLSLNEVGRKHKYSDIYDSLSYTEGDDLLGLLYQSLSIELYSHKFFTT